MGIRKLVNNYGYTLMELIIAMAAIITISSIAVPSYTRYIASTREKVCIIDRQTILYEYHMNCIGEPEITLSDYISIYYAGEINYLCPSGGTYTANGSGELAALTCSVHPDVITESGTGPTPTDIP